MVEKLIETHIDLKYIIQYIQNVMFSSYIDIK